MVAGSYNRIALQRQVRAYIKGFLRRQADRFLPSRETRRYQKWIRRRVVERQQQYRAEPQAGLFSVLTAVWDGSPLQPLRTLAASLGAQNFPCEWVVLDNGCRNPQLLAYLKELSSWSWVKLLRVENNAGILRGLRLCLESAGGKYVLPVDADDVLYPDALRIVASHAAGAGYPVLLYTDEDKVIGSRVYQPYVKPDWDPVLLLNSAYIAHLGVMDREKALELGIYTDERAEGSPDWDAFVRFLIAGYRGVHIPEVVYSWRVHAQSTADDAAHKAYVHSSQRVVLERYLAALPHGADFQVEYNQLFGGGAHFRLVRRQEAPMAMTTIRINTTDGLLKLYEVGDRDGFVALIGEDVRIEDADWRREAQSLFELHADAVMVGGQIQNLNGRVMDAGSYFGFGGVVGSPDRGRNGSDPGYFGGVWKRRSVSAVSTQFAVIRTEFLKELLGVTTERASLAFLGAWAGAHAMRTGRRVIYSPFFRGMSRVDWDALVEDAERRLFRELNGDLIPDQRFYSRHFSLRKPFELELSD